MSQIIYSKIEKWSSLSFEQYLQIDGHSHSSLKNQKDGIQKEFKITDKIIVGKLVDDIITNKSENIDITHHLYKAAKDIAMCMKSELGESLLKLLKFQLSYSAFMSFEEFKMRIKGRPDAELGQKAVIDFKVNNSCKSIQDCIKLIEFMGYDNQVYNYKRLGRQENAFIFMYSTVVKKTFFLKRLGSQLDMDLAENWWINKIIENGLIS